MGLCRTIEALAYSYLCTDIAIFRHQADLCYDIAIFCHQADGWKEEGKRTDGWENEETSGRRCTHELRARQTNERTDGQTDKQTNRMSDG